MNTQQYIIFTDLDGTLLDHNTYSYREAQNGLDLIYKKKALLVLVSSKTFDEMKTLHQELDLDSPFIFENGGGIANPDASGSYSIELTGDSEDLLLDQKETVETLLRTSITPLSSMPLDQISSLTGLSRKKAALARKRRASMPFITEKPIESDLNLLSHINSELEKTGHVLTKGGRFFHLSSISSTKGNAIKKVLRTMISSLGSVISAAIGDSENDISMFAVVDRPFLVRKPGGHYIETKLDNITVTANIGPAGFSEALHYLLNEGS